MRLVSGANKQDAYPGNFLRLLRLGSCGMRNEHGAKSEAKDVGFLTIACCLVPNACFHLITLSALASTFGGIVRPICFAVLRLMTSSNFVGCSTGRSAGFVPFRILST